MMRNVQKGGVVAAVLISVLVVAVLAVAALVFTGVFVARSVRVEKSSGEQGASVKIETPVGALRVQKGTADPRRLDIPIYPGAALSAGDGKMAGLEWDFGNEHKEISVLAARYTTTDPASKVVEYYRRELPDWILSRKRNGHFRIEHTEGGYKRIIAIHERGGTTEIALASVGEPAAN